jgi:2-oxoglutarate/2-oxoacid ferredoxin oxidoreductase subunit beta
VEYAPGESREVVMPDGSTIVLKKLGEDHDPTDREQALRVLHQARDAGRLVTGLLYVDTASRPYTDELDLVDTPLAHLPLERVRPPRATLDAIVEQLRTGKGLSAPAGGG